MSAVGRGGCPTRDTSPDSGAPEFPVTVPANSRWIGRCLRLVSDAPDLAATVAEWWSWSDSPDFGIRSLYAAARMGSTFVRTGRRASSPGSRGLVAPLEPERALAPQQGVLAGPRWPSE